MTHDRTATSPSPSAPTHTPASTHPAHTPARTTERTPASTPAHARSTDLASRLLAAGLLAGGAIAAAAFLSLSGARATSASGDAPEIVLHAPSEPPREDAVPPALLEGTATATQAMSIAEPAAIAAKPPNVALAHDDVDTDYAAKARAEVEVGQLEEALVSLRKHLYRHEPSAALLLEVGRLARETGAHALSEQALLDAAALDPRSVDAQLELARSLLDAGQLDEARAHARQAIRLDPESAAAWNIAGRVAMQQSAWARAEAAFRRALELEPMNAMIHNNLGLLYVHLGWADEAVDSLETAVELFDERVPYFVFNNLGLAYEQVGDLDEARATFEKALVVNPTYTRAKVNLERVATRIAEESEAGSFDTASGPAAQPGATEAAPAL